MGNFSSFSFGQSPRTYGPTCSTGSSFSLKVSSTLPSFDENMQTVNTIFCFINPIVSLQYIVMVTIQDELVGQSIIQHRWFVSTLAIWVPFCEALFYPYLVL